MGDRTKRNDNAADRRTAKRFAIEQEMSYKILDHRVVPPQKGAGITLDISSRGVLFETAGNLPAGKRVEIAVNWPANLESGCPLKFVAFGRLVRSGPGRAAMRIEQYEFRTRRPKDASPLPAEEPSRPRVPYY